MFRNILAVLLFIFSTAGLPVFGADKPELPKVEVSKLHADNPKIESRLMDLIDNLQKKRTTLVNAQVKRENIFIQGGKIKLEALLAADKPAFSELSALGVERDDLYFEMNDRIQLLISYRNIGELVKLANIGFVQIPLTAIQTLITSEGVSALHAEYYHNAGLKGSGVKVAILDSGFEGYESLLGTELPSSIHAISFYNSISGNGDFSSGGVHGAACAEIIHDIAPDADIYLLRYGTIAELDAAINYAIREGISIISCSMAQFNSSFYDGTGPISEIVDYAEKAGIVWINSAGNFSTQHYSDIFKDSDQDNWMEFPYGGSEFLTFSAVDGDNFYLYLTWNDWPASTNDFNLYLYDPNVTLIGWSENQQNGTQPPAEAITGVLTATGTYGISILNYASFTNNRFHIICSHTLGLYSSAGSITDPAAAKGAISIAAINVADNSLESFSSHGPTSDGRVKPDLASYDNVSTASYANKFYGTSAACPHAAGVAALLLSENPTRTPDDIKNYLAINAIDMGTAGKDNSYGYGRIVLPQINIPPQITSTAVTSAKEDQAFSYDVEASDADVSNTLTYSLTVAPTGMTINSSTGIISWTPNNDDVGDTTVTVSVSDGAGGTDTQTFSLTVANTNDPPTITTNPDTLIVAGQAYQEDFEANDVDTGDKIVWSLANKPSGMNIDSSTGKLTWLSDASDIGDVAVAVVATDDSSAADTLSYTLHVTSPKMPVFTALPAITFYEDNADSSVDLDDYVADGDHADSELAFSWDYISSDAVPGIGGRIDASSHRLYLLGKANWFGAERISIKATDPTGLVGQVSLEVTVKPVNDPPQIITLPDTLVAAGQAYSISFQASDPDPDDIIAWSLLVGPECMTMKSTTGQLVWLPDSSDVGDTLVAVVAIDDSSAADTLSYALKVAESAVSGPVVDQYAPKVLTLPSITFAEDGSDSTVDLDNYVEDQDHEPSDIVWNWAYSANYRPLFQSNEPQLGIKIDSLTHKVYLKGGPDWYGSQTIAFQAIDPTGLVGQNTMKVTVTPVNDRPLVYLPADTTFEAPDSLSFLIFDFVDDVDDPDSTLSLSAIGLPATGLRATYWPSSMLLTVNRIGVWTGDGEIILTVTDRSGLSVADTMQVAVTAASGLRDMVSADLTPEQFFLKQNYPNPFNPETRIAFGLPEPCEIRLDICNISGQLVRTLVSGRLNAGSYTVNWNGRDDRGVVVTSGVYFYILRASEFRQTKRMVLVK